MITYVFAANYRHFVFWCQNIKGVSPHNNSEYKYVSEPHTLWGVDPTQAEFIFYETFWGHPDAREIYDQYEYLKAIELALEAAPTREKIVEPTNGLFTKTFWKRTGERVVATLAQVLLGVLTAGSIMNMDWKAQITVVVTATAASLLKNIVGAQLGSNSADPSWIPTTTEDKAVDKKIEAETAK